MEENLVVTKQNKKILKNWPLGIFLLFIVVLYFTFRAPSGNSDTIVHIKEGENVSTIRGELITKNVIRNTNTFKLFLKLLGSNKGIISGDYLIKKGSPVWYVAFQFGRGFHNINPIKVTLREGLTNEEMATVFSNKIISFDKNSFLTSTEGKQGYLFPDTYFFYPLDSTDEIIAKLESNFKNRTEDLNIPKNLNRKGINEIITMASILEGEAAGKDDVGIISGILWERISLGMPLQVDTDKSTYTSKGLPSNPLNNPGLVTINAAMKPIQSPYLYYLHDKNGKVHYAVTFEEHKRNISNYLK